MDATSVHADSSSRSRRIALALLLVAASTLIACGPADSLHPPTTDTTTTGVPPGRPPFVEPSRAATIYTETSELYADCASRFVLFEDSTFHLQLACSRRGLLIYGGQYTRTDGTITFELAGWNASVIRRANAYVVGDTLGVVYNGAMDLEGFANGSYVRQRTPGPPSDPPHAGAESATLGACLHAATRDTRSPLVQSELARSNCGTGLTAWRLWRPVESEPQA